MFVVTGATGKVGGAMAQALLNAGASVRVVTRDPARGAEWEKKGCEIAVADMEDAQALTSAFRDAEGVFILPPPEFDPSPDYPEALRVIEAVVAALKSARPARVLCLSTVGASATEDNLLSQRTLLEKALTEVDLPVAFLRPAWFLDNIEWDIPTVREEGVLRSFLQPPERAIPMVAARDVGEYAAMLIQEEWTGRRILNLEGPTAVSPQDIADALADALSRPVRIEEVPRSTWEDLFKGQGMHNPLPRVLMLDGFNEGWISFDRRTSTVAKGRTGLTDVVAMLLGEERPQLVPRGESASFF